MYLFIMILFFCFSSTVFFSLLIHLSRLHYHFKKVFAGLHTTRFFFLFFHDFSDGDQPAYGLSFTNESRYLNKQDQIRIQNDIWNLKIMLNQ